MTKKFRFDKEYYRTWYVDRRSNSLQRVRTPYVVRFVLSYAELGGIPIRSALDLGCGFGYWKRYLQAYHPYIRYRGVEISRYLCERYAWTYGSMVDYDDGHLYDLVICSHVLQYLDDTAARSAIENLARLTRSVLYLVVPTSADLVRIYAPARTDRNIYVRTKSWYFGQLRKSFISAGGGVFFHRRAPVYLPELSAIW
jgi:SAM-dependent methyltransferase